MEAPIRVYWVDATQKLDPCQQLIKRNALFQEKSDGMQNQDMEQRDLDRTTDKIVCCWKKIQLAGSEASRRPRNTNNMISTGIPER